jgi:hypothetical protein
MKKLVTFTLTACMAFSFAACNPTNSSADPKEKKYTEACALLEKRDYEGAYALFAALGDYKDAAKQTAYFRYMPTSHYVDCNDNGEEEHITYTVTLNEQNLPQTVVEEYDTGFKHTCTITHNEFGLVTRRECSDTEGETTLYVATYDANGNLTHETITEADGTVKEFDYQYNENGQRIYFTDYSYSYTYTYDAEGKEIKIVSESSEGVRIEENTYNADGNLVKKTWASEDGTVDVIYNCVYDEKGRLTEMLFTEHGEERSRRRIAYNDKDQIITEHVFYYVDINYEYTYN